MADAFGQAIAVIEGGVVAGSAGKLAGIREPSVREQHLTKQSLGRRVWIVRRKRDCVRPTIFCFDLIKWLLRHGVHLDTTGLADQRGAKRRTARDRRQQGEDCHYSQGGKRDHCSDGTFGIESTDPDYQDDRLM